MNKYWKKLFLVVVLASSIAFANAQDDTTLVKEVTVSQEYNPTVNDAFKLGRTPVVEQPQSYQPSFDYSFYNAPLRTEYEIQFIGAEDCDPQLPKYDWKQNYVKGGGGNYSTLLGELFYNAYNSEIQNVNIFYRNRSSWGKVRLQDETKVDAPLFINQGKVDFQRRYRRSVLSTSLLFDRKGYEYYGYHTLKDNTTYSYTDGTSLSALDKGRQFVMDFGVETKLSSINSSRSDVRYESALSFHSVSNNDKFAENNIALSTIYAKDLKKVTFGFEVNTNLGLCSKSDPSLSRAYDDETFYGIDVAPYLQWVKKNWNLKAGARFDYYYKGIIQEMNVSPVLDFNFNIVPKYFTGFVKGQGGIKQNTYAQTVQANRFIANNIELKPTKVPVDVKAGFIGHPTKELTLQLNAGYQLIQDQLFFVNEFVSDDNNAADISSYTNRFTAEYDDNNVIAFHGEINYNSYKRWAANIAADYYSYNLKTLAEAWNLPEFKIVANGRYRITDKITATASFLFMPERKAKVSQANAIYSLPVVYDLTLGAEYKCKDNLSFFLDINNALASKYYLYNGYPSQRFNLVAGAVFRF